MLNGYISASTIFSYASASQTDDCIPARHSWYFDTVSNRLILEVWGRGGGHLRITSVTTSSLEIGTYQLQFRACLYWEHYLKELLSSLLKPTSTQLSISAWILAQVWKQFQPHDGCALLMQHLPLKLWSKKPPSAESAWLSLHLQYNYSCSAATLAVLYDKTVLAGVLRNILIP